MSGDILERSFAISMYLVSALRYGIYGLTKDGSYRRLFDDLSGGDSLVRMIESTRGGTFCPSFVPSEATMTSPQVGGIL